MPSREEMLKDIGLADARSHIANGFGIYAKPQMLARFLMRYELMKMVLPVHGSIVECGVKWGAGVFEWFQLSRLLEPLNWTRMVYGFDTFEGFPSISDKDGNAQAGEQAALGDTTCEHLAAWAHAVQLERWVVMHDGEEMMHPTKWHQICDLRRIQFIKGDFLECGPHFFKATPWLVVSLLYLDFDLYEPTKLALELFLPRMPKGAVVAFDELNHPGWPGETLAVLDSYGFRNLRLRRFPFEPTVSYAVL